MIGLLTFSLFLSFATANIGGYMMMPFKTFTNYGEMASDQQLLAWFNEIEQRGFKGVTLDFWWGFIEKSPQNYDFSSYLRFAQVLGTTSLKLKVILSFHQCGSTIGDKCYIPLPDFVHSADDKFFYKDQNGKVNKEYISIFADHTPMSDGRTPVQMYEQLTEEFYSQFEDFFGRLIVDVELGTGPAGQLHYPSYSYENGFCGVGMFQSFGELARESFAEYTKGVQIETIDQWNRARLNNMGRLNSPLVSNPNSEPHNEYFFRKMDIESEKCMIHEAIDKIDCGEMGINAQGCLSRGCCYKEVQGHNYCYRPKEVWNYKADFGKVLSHWYQQSQLTHLQTLLRISRKVLTFRIPLSIKIPCVHWMTGHPSRAAERTAGFNNNSDLVTLPSDKEPFVKYLLEDDNYTSDEFESTSNRIFSHLPEYLEWTEEVNTYQEIFHLARLFKTKVVFSCMELSDQDFDPKCHSKPQQLIQEFKEFSAQTGVPIVAENSESLMRENFQQKLKIIEENLPGFYQFNYMRMDDAVGVQVNFEEIYSKLMDKLDHQQSKNFYRKRKIILIEDVSCRNCYGDLQNFKMKLRLV